MILKSERKFNAKTGLDSRLCNVGAGIVGASIVGSLLTPQQKAIQADPNVGAAAKENSKVAADTLEFNKKVYADGEGDRAFASDFSKKVANNQFADSVTQQGRATEQWDRYLKTFAPIEEQTANDAKNIDSLSEQERIAGDAAGTVQAQSDNANAQRARTQASMGVNPNSGAAIAADADSAIRLAAGKSGTVNDARQAVRDRGVAMRSGVANFGRNMLNTTATMSGLSTASGNAGVGNATNPVSINNSGAAQMNQGFGTAISGYNAAGSILNNQFSNSIAAEDSAHRANAASAAGWGSLAGAGIAYAGYTGGFGGGKPVPGRK